MRNFSVLREGFGPSPIAPAEEETEANVASDEKDMACAKGCGKVCGSGAGKAKHEKYCKGMPKDTAVLEVPRRIRKPKRKAKAARRVQKKVGPIDNALDLLYAQRDSMIQAYPELDSVMNAIGALEELR